MIASACAASDAVIPPKYSSSTTRALRDAGPFPPVPVRVLTATGGREGLPRLERAWAEAQADLARLSPWAEQEICERCGHYVQRDDPKRVIDAIRELVEGRTASDSAAPGR